MGYGTGRERRSRRLLVTMAAPAIGGERNPAAGGIVAAS